LTRMSISPPRSPCASSPLCCGRRRRAANRGSGHGLFRSHARLRPRGGAP
jgi:hypothetical protein